MTTAPCPACKGRCCRDEFGYRIEHMAAEFYDHVCDACCNGVQYAPMRTVEEERADVVAFLRTTEPPRMWAALLDAADRIERSEHLEKKP